MIKRIEVSHRFSEVAIHNGVAYLAGQVPTDPSKNAFEQTKQVLAEIDKYLTKAGSDKSIFARVGRHLPCKICDTIVNSNFRKTVGNLDTFNH